MDNKIRKANFFRFDGEGGEGSAAASAPSQEQSEVKPQEIRYGKPKKGEAQTGQVGSDAGGQAQDLNAEFAELIGKGGKYHDIYGQKVSEVVKDRFKNQADLQGQVDQISEDLSPLFMNYGLESGDFEGLKTAIANDDAFYQAGAERAGLSIEQYKANLKLQADAERGRQISEAYKNEQRKHAVYAQWEAEAEALREAFPGFDLGLEIEHNETFRRALDAGVDVKSAFVSAHLPEILAGANAEATAKATETVVNAMHSRASRPVEGGVRHTAAIVRRSDPSSLSNEDLDEINRRVANGESISF